MSKVTIEWLCRNEPTAHKTQWYPSPYQQQDEVIYIALSTKDLFDIIHKSEDCNSSPSHGVTAELLLFWMWCICMIWPVTINVGKEWMIVCIFFPLFGFPQCLFLPSSTHYLSVWLSLFHIRDILPFTLKLPEAIHSAATLSDLHEVAQQGAGTDQACLTHLKYRI